MYVPCGLPKLIFSGDPRGNIRYSGERRGKSKAQGAMPRRTEGSRNAFGGSFFFGGENANEV